MRKGRGRFLKKAPQKLSEKIFHGGTMYGVPPNVKGFSKVEIRRTVLLVAHYRRISFYYYFYGQSRTPVPTKFT